MLKVGVLFEKEEYIGYDISIDIYKPLCIVTGFISENNSFCFTMEKEKFYMKQMLSNHDYVVDLINDLDKYIVDNEIDKSLLNIEYGNALRHYYTYSFQKINCNKPTPYTMPQIAKLLEEHNKIKKLEKDLQ